MWSPGSVHKTILIIKVPKGAMLTNIVIPYIRYTDYMQFWVIKSSIWQSKSVKGVAAAAAELAFKSQRRRRRASIKRVSLKILRKSGGVLGILTWDREEALYLIHKHHGLDLNLMVTLKSCVGYLPSVLQAKILGQSFFWYLGQNYPLESCSPMVHFKAKSLRVILA